MTPRLAESPNQNHPAQLCKLRRTLRQNDFVIHQPAQNLWSAVLCPGQQDDSKIVTNRDFQPAVSQNNKSPLPTLVGES
jgi:hypothetical protein